MWPCARALAEHLVAPPAPNAAAAATAPLRSKRVLELGAGCGYAGLAAWLAGAEAVCLTDLPENVPRPEPPPPCTATAPSAFGAQCTVLRALPLCVRVPNRCRGSPSS